MVKFGTEDLKAMLLGSCEFVKIALAKRLFLLKECNLSFCPISQIIGPIWIKKENPREISAKI